MKRYVLLDNGIIYDRNKLSKDRDWLILRILERIDKGETNNLVRQIKLQSDNLIDLLEVGDCYETKDAEIYSIDNTYELTEQKAFYSYNVNLINAIWKRNGDIMRRYEVE
jgi:hypothetical protein